MLLFCCSGIMGCDRGLGVKLGKGGPFEMPSVTKAQHDLMVAVAHGWKPKGVKVPSVKVAKEFLSADRAAGRFQGKKRG